MKARAALPLGFAIAASLAISGCGRAASPPVPQRPASSAALPKPASPAARHGTRLTLTEAQTLIATWRKQHVGERRWSRKAMLWEITPADVWDRMGAQVFHYASPFAGQERWKAAGLHPGAEDAYFVRDRRVYTLLPGSSGFGGIGIEQMCVCDLDHDSRPELIYTHSFGSGSTQRPLSRCAWMGPARACSTAERHCRRPGDRTAGRPDRTA